MGNSSVSIRIQSEAIYLHSIAVLSFSSDSPFLVGLPSTLDVIQVTKGKRATPDNESEGTLLFQSHKTERKTHSVEVSAIGLFDERNASWGHDELGNRYGMRFYPFVSSIIRGKFTCSQQIESIIIEIPNSYRFIFAQSSITQNETPSLLRHSYGEDNSLYVFTWDKEEVKSADEYQLFADVSVRYGGRSLLRIVQFPIFYWLGAVIAIALLSLTENIYVVLGAVAAAWVFLLERWDSSSLPQKGTILTHFYLLFGAVLLIWGIMWHYLGIKTLYLMGPVILLMFILALWGTKRFNETGELPGWFARFYAEKVIGLDRKRARRKRNTQ